MIIIRDAELKDHHGLNEVYDSAITTLRKTYRPNKKAIGNKEKISKKSSQLVAVIINRIVGTVRYYTEKDKLNIIGLDVHESYRRIGVAKGLIDHLMNKFRTSSITHLSLHTIKETGNVPIFKKMSFKVMSETIDDLSISNRFDTLTDVTMYRLIDNATE